MPAADGADSGDCQQEQWKEARVGLPMPAKLDDFETGSGERASQRLLRESHQMAEFEGRMAGTGPASR